MRDFLKSILDIRKGEILITFLMFANYYLILMTYYFLKPARDSLFLIKVSPEMLPLVFIITALVTAPVVSMYSKASRSFKLNRLIYLTYLIIIVNLVVLRWLVTINQNWVYYAFYTWVSIFGALTTSQFWLLANAVFNAAQAKRIFVLLGLGGIVGAFTGGEVTGIIVKNFDVATENLLLFCIGLLVICGVIINVVWSIKKRDDQTVEKTPGRLREGRENLMRVFSTVFQSRHLLLIVGIVAMTMMVASFVDFQFKTVSYQSFSDKSDLTSFLGKFYGRLSLVSLVLQMVFAYRIIRFLGVGGVIMFLPLGLMAGSVFMFLAPGLTAAVLLRGTDGSIKYSLDKTGRELLFLPLSLEVKKRTKIFIDMFVDRWFRGLAGGLLLLCTLVLQLSVKQISLVVIGLLLVWLVLTVLMRREYINSFRRAIEKRTIDFDQLRIPINDRSTIDTLLKLLESGNTRQVVYALDTLSHVKKISPGDRIVSLLSHESSEVRSKAVELLRMHGSAEQSEQVERLLSDSDLEVRRAAVHFLITYGRADRHQNLRRFLDHEDSSIKFAAMACLVEDGREQDYELISRSFINSVLDSNDDTGAEGRRQLARLMGRMDVPEYKVYIERLLEDSSLEVVKAAIEAIGNLRDRHYLPLLLEKLADRRYRVVARNALAQFGTTILGTLHDYLMDEKVEYLIRANLPRVMKLIPDQQTVDILTDCLEKMPPALKYEVVKALNSLRTRYVDLRFDSDELETALIHETRSYYEILQILYLRDRFIDNPASKLLQKALVEKQEHNLERIFRLLGLVYPPDDIYNAYLGITSGKKELHANAIEFLDNLLRSNIKKYIFPILDDISDESILRKAESLFKVSRKDTIDALAYLIEGRDSWLSACAIYYSIDVRSDRLRQMTEKMANCYDPIIRETARLALARTG